MIDKDATTKAIAQIICDPEMDILGTETKYYYCENCYEKAEKIVKLLREGVILSKYD